MSLKLWGLNSDLDHAFLSSPLSLSLSLSLSPCMTGRVSVKDGRLLFCFYIAMASNDTSPPKRERTASENDSDNDFDEIITLCEEVVELNIIQKKAEEARRSETGQMTAARLLLTRLAKKLYRQGQQIARHGRVDRLEKFGDLLTSLPEEVHEGIASTDVGKKLFELSNVLVEAAMHGFVELITYLCQTAQFKESEMKHAARVAFLFRRTDVIQAFAKLGFDMDEDAFLADVLALKNTPVSGQIPFGASSSSTAARQSCSHLELLKAALRGDQTQVVQCVDEVGSAGAESAGCPSENEDENVNWMECHRRVFSSGNDKLAPTKKDAIINIAILVTIAGGHHQALRVLLDQAGPTWKNVTMLKKPVSVAQFDTTPMNLAVLSGNVHTVQVLLGQVRSLSAFTGFLKDAMMHERLDIVLYLVKQAKALINGAEDVDRELHRLLLQAIHCTLFTAIERRSRSVVKFIFEEFKRVELLFDDVDDRELDKFVQGSNSLPIMFAFLLWCPDYVKNQLQVEPNLAEVWPLGHTCVLEAKSKLEKLSVIPESSDAEVELQMGWS